MKTLSIITAATATLLLCGNLLANPVAYKNARQLMLGYSDSTQFAELFYTNTPSTAFGLHTMRLENENEEFKLFSLRHNWLLKRWNMEEAQANIYAGAGLGASKTDSLHTRFAGEGFFQADYETRRYYSAFRSHAMHSSDSTHFWNTLSLGIAPYKAEYNELNPWLIMRAEYITEFHDRIQFTPTLRFFKDNIFIEIGISFDGELQTLFMIHF